MLLKKLRTRIVLVLLLSVCSGTFAERAEAQAPISGGQAAGILAAILAVGAGVGVGIYYLARRPPTVTGCTVDGSDGMSLQNESDHQNFMLIGNTTDLKAGERVSITGRKKRKDAKGTRPFVVEKVKKNFGMCSPPGASSRPYPAHP